MKTIGDIADQYTNEMFHAIVGQGLRSVDAVLACESTLTYDEQILLEGDDLLHHECFVEAVCAAYDHFGLEMPDSTTWDSLEELPGGENETNPNNLQER